MKAVEFAETVRSDRDPSREYRIAGRIECDCTGFATRGYCKHLRRKIDALLAPKRRTRK